jgi:hypothetical protein
VALDQVGLFVVHCIKGVRAEKFLDVGVGQL